MAAPKLHKATQLLASPHLNSQKKQDSKKTDLPLYMCLYFLIFTLILVDSVEFDSSLCRFVCVIRGILEVLL